MKPVIIIAIAFVVLFALLPTASFAFGDSLPNWVRNIFLWYGQDQVSEDELLDAIKYLITEGIIEIETSSQECSGTAKCITGTVTKIIDGDTIHVDGQKIRFALASAPELGNYGSGVEATEFIQTICPVGSKVLVDEDDGQTPGSYGRIIGVIYCNGMNLNSELLDAGLGNIEFRSCDISEFGNTDWAIKHGC